MADNVYTGSWDNTVRKLDSAGNQIWSFTGHTGSVNEVAVDTGGNVYTGSSDNTVRKLDSAGNQIWSFTGHTGSVNVVAVDRDGNVYTGSRDNTARKLDSAGNQIWSFTGHTVSVNGVAVDTDGNVYTGSSDNTARKLDSAGNQIWSFTGHTPTVFGIAVDPGLCGAGFWSIVPVENYNEELLISAVFSLNLAAFITGVEYLTTLTRVGVKLIANQLNTDILVIVSPLEIIKITGAVLSENILIRGPTELNIKYKLSLLNVIYIATPAEIKINDIEYSKEKILTTNRVNISLEDVYIRPDITLRAEQVNRDIILTLEVN